MSMFGQMKDMYKLQQQAKKIKKELSKIHVFAEDDLVKVTVNGEQQMVKIEILAEKENLDPRKLEKSILDCTNRATKKAQQVSAEKMKSVMGGFPGLGGQ